jgi:hypothetical protein
MRGSSPFDFAQGQNDRRCGQVEREQTTAKASAGRERFLHPTHRGKAAMDGAPGRFWLVVEDNCNGNSRRRSLRDDNQKNRQRQPKEQTTTTKRTDNDNQKEQTTTKKERQRQERTDDDKDEMRGFFPVRLRSGSE